MDNFLNHVEKNAVIDKKINLRTIFLVDIVNYFVFFGMESRKPQGQSEYVIMYTECR